MAVKTSWSSGDVLTAADLTDTFAAKLDTSGGKVLQVVSTVKTDTFSTSSSTFTDVTGLSVSITPSSATSKILVMANVMASQSGSDKFGLMRLLRGSTTIYMGDAASNRTQALSNIWADGTIFGSDRQTNTFAPMYLDSPATTSSITYKIQIANAENTTAFYINRSGQDADAAKYARTASSITVMEVSA